MNKSVKIRCDGSSEIGLGHIVRCISLAHMLKADFDISFYCISILKSLKEEILNNGWSLTKLENESDFEEYLTGSEIVVLDGYQFDSAYQKQVKEQAGKLVCIDDFHDQHFYADIVINHAPGVSVKDYKSEPYTKYLLGPEYALLRPEFLNIDTEEKQLNYEVKNILICFGGSDAKNLTSKILSWLPTNHYNIRVIIGNAFQHQDELEQVIADRNDDMYVTIKSSLTASQMVEEIKLADLVIVPASGILFEAIIMGSPAISGYYVENQKEIYNGFKELDALIGVENFGKKEFTEAFNAVNVKTLSQIRQNQRRIIDGFSNNRIFEEFKNIKGVCV
jgi:UDP-2,4-diacetamido-2,4,6-trideoxy-beta-L-altropyranose hydrolase